ALIIDEPLRPSEASGIAHRLAWARAVRNRLRGIGNVLVVGRIAALRLRETQLQVAVQIKRRGFRGAAAFATRRPRGQPSPDIGSGFKRGDGSNIKLRSIVF